MFTGIIEKVARVEATRAQGSGTRVSIATGFVDLTLGESVAVDGVCLTVAELGQGGNAAFDLSAETLSRSALGELRQGAKVNLERAMKSDGRFSGHIVQGHVDGVGEVESWSEQSDGSRGLRVRLPAGVSRYCVEKGSLTVQGVSLTVNRILGDTVEIMIVPHTWGHTSFSSLPVGSRLNLEADVIAKYVEKLMERAPCL